MITTFAINHLCASPRQWPPQCHPNAHLNAQSTPRNIGKNIEKTWQVCLTSLNGGLSIIFRVKKPNGKNRTPPLFVILSEAKNLWLADTRFFASLRMTNKKPVLRCATCSVWRKKTLAGQKPVRSVHWKSDEKEMETPIESRKALSFQNPIKAPLMPASYSPAAETKKEAHPNNGCAEPRFRQAFFLSQGKPDGRGEIFLLFINTSA